MKKLTVIHEETSRKGYNVIICEVNSRWLRQRTRLQNSVLLISEPLATVERDINNFHPPSTVAELLDTFIGII